jgi:hypothetical protein
MNKDDSKRQLNKDTYDSIEFLDTTGGLLDGAHLDETEPTGPVGLLLVENDISRE